MTCIHTRMCLCSKNRYFENFRLILPLTLEVHKENTPYSSSELNESDIVNRQSGGEKLKYVLKFYIAVYITWYRACATTIQHCVDKHMMFGAEYLGNRWDRVFQRTTNRKLPMGVEWSCARWCCVCRSFYLEQITYWHATSKNDKIVWNYRKTANIIEKLNCSLSQR